MKAGDDESRFHVAISLDLISPRPDNNLFDLENSSAVCSVCVTFTATANMSPSSVCVSAEISATSYGIELLNPLEIAEGFISEHQGMHILR
ncbi:hypothetical protein CDAR_284061 [Caerostris darwini]|uniref:Uncharacterized protein n=1 Tax=Caerostris darwini TaxID=1538125 RepID=A0AAV4PLG5_9ARAC|nr:hypothetical protein CDAR_284061 [Caerostris darwini]